MKSLYPMADIMTLMTKIEGNITKLGVIYTSEEARNAIDEGLIDQFVVKAGELTTAANALKGITFAG
jgi:hypothetical protein